MKKIILLFVCATFFSIEHALSQTKSIFDRADFIIEHPDSMNTVASDISPCFVGNQLYYSSVRKSWWDKEQRLKKNMAFFNQYHLPTDDSGVVIEGTERKLVAGLGADYHQGPVAYCEKTGELFVTMSNVADPDSVQRLIMRADIRLRLVIMKNKSGEWKTTEEFPFNDKRYHFAHPAISESGDTLVFSSDMPGGKGKSDLYMSIRQSGQWSTPVNLGDGVNTSGNEMFPTFLPGDLLSFASDGHAGGYGFMDIWYTSFPVIGEVKNAGEKINTQFDDFGLVINPNLKVGYLCSNRPGKGKDDIFRVDIRLYMTMLKVVCYDDQTKKILPSANLKLCDLNGKAIDTRITGKDGSAEFHVESMKKYQLYADKADYIPVSKAINITSSSSDLMQEESIYLKKAAPYLVIKVVDKETKEIIPNAKIAVTEGKYDQSVFATSEDSTTMKLNQETNYTFAASADLYFDRTANFSSVGKTTGSYMLTIELEKLEVGKQIVLDDLFYDLNKYNIRTDAALVLDRLVKVLTENPTIRIEVGSHTDSRATAEYNLKLSQNRSESVMAYLVKRGIDKSRLTAKGYGESQLVNKCADGVPCTEEEHQENRRTVIKILNPEIRNAKRGKTNIYYF